MIFHPLRQLIPVALVLVSSLAAPSAKTADSAGRPGFLDPDAAVRERLTDPLVPSFRDCLAQRPDDSVKFWVFFTDKEVRNKADFQRAATSIRLTERATNRRAKVGLNRVVFADLPVSTSYISEIEALGARHRRSSRWLNAATFIARPDVVENISRLPYVSEVRPVSRYRRAPEPIDETRPVPQEGGESVHALNYGVSFNQLNQIGVPAVHDLGYSGQGVTLAILDTGARRAHQYFAAAYAEGRVLAEYDFINDDTNVDYEAANGDFSSQPNHGTQVWGVAGGIADGFLYGPAYGANFIICKTEDIRSEMPVEEDNWVAAMEFSDSIGADVLTSSLGYLDFDDSCGCNYTYADMNGLTAISSVAASMADSLGIVVTKSAGNEGPGAGTITAPADAFDILAVGAVDSNGLIAGFSSRGPTSDNRIKPEVCARGVSTITAHPTSLNTYAAGSGTSFAAPLVGGAACLVIEAHPDWSPRRVREALKMSGTMAGAPDNTYGWGIIKVDSAIRVDFGCCSGRVGDVNGLGGDVPTIGDVTMLIDFLFISLIPPACLAEADINQSGGANPQEGDISIGDVTQLIDHLFIAQLPLPFCI
ncbi:MAG: S8 family serine peptidase [Candidatus Zixiibacteriota bacterium]